MATDREVDTRCPKCKGPFADVRGVAFNADQFRMEDGRCFQFDKNTVECREDHLAKWRPMAERPLHVQVAEALGWTDLYESTSLTGLVRWVGVEPHGGLRLEVPRYDTSWCSTGPMVERFKICVVYRDREDQPKGFDFVGWMAFVNEDQGWVDKHSVDIDISPASGRTPCEAIARLIVELHREGKLTK